MTTSLEPTTELDELAAIEPPEGGWRDPKKFIEQVRVGEWDRLVTLLVRDNTFDVVMAERLLGQATAYLITAIENYGKPQGGGIGCGYLVDIAVHTIILDTPFYRDFCDHYFGQFLDHNPEIERKYDGSVVRTALVVARNGFRIDEPLWAADYAKCTPCYHGTTNGCH